MEKSFIVESKSFVFSVVEGASVLRVVERRKDFLGEVILSTHCAVWLASILEVLLGFPADQDFVKSFREGSKLLIARRDSNKAGRFLEATAFGLGGRRGSIRIPEGRGGWCWHKFSGELRKVSDFFSDMVGCGIRSSSAMVKKDGKEDGSRAGLISKGTGLSYAEVLRSGSELWVVGSPG
jgi:hypothetical protein